MKITRDIYLVGSGQIRLSNKMDCHVYLVDGGKELALIDAGVGIETASILKNIREDGFDEKNIRYILLTHCHADHGGGCKTIKCKTKCEIIATEIEGMLLERGNEEEIGLDIAKRSNIYPKDYSFPNCRVDRIAKDGKRIDVGKYSIDVIQIAGHSKGSTCYLLDQDGYRILFSSDIVFFGGTIGLGNWPGSNLEDYRKHIGKLSNLSVDALLPGHFLWTLREGQEHLDKAIENLKLAWVPPSWQHQHPHF